MLKSVLACQHGSALTIDIVSRRVPTVKVRLAGICSSLKSTYIDTSEFLRMSRLYFAYLR
jgi:hypothetical protein